MPTKKVSAEVSQEVKLWKENKINECVMTFSCGGDSMNDYEFKFYTSKNKTIECQELVDYFEDEVFRRVEFYENSDGHYIGEFGEVRITLNDEDEFDYEKTAKSEWSESMEETIPIGITPEEAKFLKEKVDNLNGGDGEKNINYKIDCIITDEEEEMVDNLLEKIDEACSEHQFADEEGDADDFYRWSTNPNTDNIEINGDNLSVTVSRNFTIVKETEAW